MDLFEELRASGEDLSEETVGSFYQRLANSAGNVLSSAGASEEEWAAANDNLSVLLYGAGDFPGLGEHRVNPEYLDIGSRAHRWAEFVRSRAELDRRRIATEKDAPYTYLDRDGTVAGARGMMVEEFTGAGGERMRRIFERDAASDTMLMRREENIEHERALQEGSGMIGPGGSVMGGPLKWGGLYSGSPQASLARAYEQIGEEDPFGSLEEFLHQTGAQPSGIGQPFREDGSLETRVNVSSGGVASWLKGLVGGEEPGLTLPEDLAQERMFSGDPRVRDIDQILHGPTEEDDDGRRFVRDASGVPHYLYDVHGETELNWVDENGQRQRAVVSESDLADAHEGEWYTGTVLGGLWHRFFDQRIETPYGRMVVPNITGNEIIDRKMMRDPLFLRSVMDAKSGWLRSSAKFAARLGLNVAEFGPVVGAASLGVNGARALGGSAARAAAASRGGARAAAAQFGDDVAATMTRNLNGGRAASTLPRKFRFNAQQIGDEIVYEVATSVAEGDGRTWSENLESGFEEGVAEMVIAGPVRALRRALGRGGEWFRRGQMRKAMDLVADGRIDEVGEGVFGKWRRGLVDANRPVVMEAARRMQDLSGDVAGGAKEHLMRAVSSESAPAWTAETIEAVAQAFDTGTTMGLFGAYSAGQRLAAEEGKKWESLSASQKVAYVAAGVSEPETFGMATAGIASIGASAWRRKKFPGERLSAEQRRQTNDGAESMLHGLSTMSESDLAAVVAFGDSALPEDVTRKIIETLGPRPDLGDDISGSTIEQIAALWEQEGGTAMLQEVFAAVEDVRDLEAWARQARSFSMEQERSGETKRATAGATIQAIADAELARRAGGGGPARKSKGRRKWRHKAAADVPAPELPAFFEAGEVADPEGGARAFWDLRASGMSVVEVAEGFRIVKKRDRTTPIKRDSGPYDDLGAALRAALEMRGILPADEAANLARRRARRGKGQRDIVAPTDPQAQPEASAEADAIADSLSATEQVMRSRRAAAQREAVGREPDPVGTPIPERPETIEAQLRAMREGRKPAVLVTPGADVPELEAGEARAELDEGTLIYPQGREDLPRLAREGNLAAVLGYGADQDHAQSRVVTARDDRGQVVQDVQAEPTDDVLEAAEVAAGPAGSVESRPVADALAERRGEPTVSEIEAATSEVVERLRTTPQYANADPGRIVDDWLPRESMATSRSLEARMEEMRAFARRNAPPVEPHTTKAPEVREGRRRLVDDVARADQEAADALERELSQHPELLEDDSAPPTSGESPLWAEGERLERFQQGADILRGQGGGHVDYLRLVQDTGILRARIADPEVSEAESEEAKALLDSIVAGMVYAVGGPRLQARGPMHLVAALTGVPLTDVARVRGQLLREASRNWSRIARRLPELTDRDGKRLITEKQAGRYDGASWSGGRGDTRELLALASLGPPVDWRRGAGMYPHDSLVGSVRKWAEGDGAEGLAAASGVEVAAAREHLADQANRIASALGRLTDRRNARDLRGALAKRIATAQGWTANAGLDRELPGGESLRDASQRLLSGLSGVVSGERAAGKGQLGQVEARELESGKLPVERARDEEVHEMDSRQLTARLRGIASQHRQAWELLYQVRKSDGSFYVPRGTSPALSPRTALPWQRRVGHQFLRQLRDGDPAVLELFRASTEPDGSPTFENADATWAEARDHYAESLDWAETLVKDHLAAEAAGRAEGPGEAEQTRKVVAAVFEALGHSSRREDIPPGVLEVLAEGDPWLFPEGALDTVALKSGGERRFLKFDAEQTIAETFHEVLDRDSGGLFAENVTPTDTELLFANPLPMLFDGWTPTTSSSVRTYSRFSLQALAGGRLDAQRLADWVNERAFGKAGDALTKAFGSAMRRAYAFLLPAVRAPVPRKTRSGARKVREAREASNANQRKLVEEGMRIGRKIDTLGLQPHERELIGKAIQGGAFQRISSEADWARVFGEGTEHLFTVGEEVVHLLNKLGSNLVERGVLSLDQYQKFASRYIPRMYLDGSAAERLHRESSLYWGGWSGTGRELSASEQPKEGLQQIFDIGYLLPRVVSAESGRLRLFDMLSRVVRSGEGFVSEAEWQAMGPYEKQLWVKAARPEGDGSHLFNAPSLAQMKLQRFVEEERAAELPATDEKARILNAVGSGYVSVNTLGELEILLDQTDPSGYAGGPVSDILRDAEVVWKRNKTIGSPRHWVKNFLTSIVTNGMTGKVPLTDFARFVFRGEGFYAKASEGMLAWKSWVDDGRPAPSDGDQTAELVLVIDRMVDQLGGTTFEQTVFEPADQVDMLASARFGSDRVRYDAASANDATHAVAAVSSMLARQGSPRARLASSIENLALSTDPASRAMALRSLMGQYQAVELWFKVAAALRGMENGMSISDAVFWGAEGTGDYADRNPWIYRLTTQFTAPFTKRSKDIIDRARANEGGVRYAQLAASQHVRNWLGQPFWMYYSSMMPAIGRAFVDQPLGVLAGIAAVAAAKMAVSDEREEAELYRQQAGGGDFISAELSDPATHDAFGRLYGNPKVSLGPVTASDRWKLKWENLKLYLDAAADSAKAIGTFGRYGELRPEAQMLWTGTVGKLDGRASYLDAGEWMGAGAISGAFRAATAVSAMNNEKPTFVDPREAWKASVGIMPQMALGAIGQVMELGQSLTKEGVRGKSADRVWTETLLRWGAEWSAPLTGLHPLLSSDGQRMVRAALEDGRSIAEVLDGIPRPALARTPFGSRMGQHALSLVMPLRSAPEGTRIPGMRQGLLENNLEAMQRNLGTSPGAPDELGKQYERAQRVLHDFFETSAADVYELHMSGQVGAPIDALLEPVWSGIEADIARVGDGGLELISSPRTALGKLIANQPKADQQAFLRLATEEMWALRGDISGLLVQLARKREVFTPEMVRQLTRGIFNQANDPGALVDLVSERLEDDRANVVRWYRVWQLMGVTESTFGDAKRTDQVRRIEQRFASEGVTSLPAARSFVKEIGPPIFELFPKQALSEFPDLLGSAQ